jgi:hypothetical protein
MPAFVPACCVLKEYVGALTVGALDALLAIWDSSLTDMKRAAMELPQVRLYL